MFLSLNMCSIKQLLLDFIGLQQIIKLKFKFQKSKDYFYKCPRIKDTLFL